jgi:hypothetical protein
LSAEPGREGERLAVSASTATPTRLGCTATAYTAIAYTATNPDLLSPLCVPPRRTDRPAAPSVAEDPTA